VNDLKVLIKEIFVTHTSNLGGGSVAKQERMSKLGFVGGLFGQTTEAQVVIDKALNLEETRKKYEADLSLIFTSIEEENKQISKLIDS
jgi:hypothetical protein